MILKLLALKRPPPEKLHILQLNNHQGHLNNISGSRSVRRTSSEICSHLCIHPAILVNHNCYAIKSQSVIALSQTHLEPTLPSTRIASSPEIPVTPGHGFDENECVMLMRLIYLPNLNETKLHPLNHTLSRSLSPFLQSSRSSSSVLDSSGRIRARQSTSTCSVCANFHYPPCCQSSESPPAQKQCQHKWKGVPNKSRLGLK